MQLYSTGMMWVLAWAGYVDDEAGGDLVKRLQRAAEVEVTVTNTDDHLVMTAEVSHASKVLCSHA